MRFRPKTPVSAKPYRSHDDATVASFAKDPGYAAAYLTAVLKDGDEAERQAVLTRIVRAAGGGASAAGD